MNLRLGGGGKRDLEVLALFFVAWRADRIAVWSRL